MSERTPRSNIRSTVTTSTPAISPPESYASSAPTPLFLQRRAPSGSDWIDVHDSPPRRTSSKRSSSKRLKDRQRPTPESDVNKFFPRLARILEANESVLSFKGTSTHRRHYSSSSTKRSSAREERYHRPVEHKVGRVHRRSQPSYPRSNPSLLSVVSGLTGVSDRSSGSNSTITQRSYNRKEGIATPHPAQRHPPVNVFDFMMPPAEHRTRSVRSSSTSSSRSVESGNSSDAPGTPSSRSTIPSPTERRKGSVSELRKKYDMSYAASNRSNSASPDVPSTRSAPSVTDIAEADDEDEEQEAVLEDRHATRPTHHAPEPPTYASYHPPDDPHHPASDHWRKQDSFRRQHMAYAVHAQNSHYADSTYGMSRSSSGSSAASDPYAYYQALQQYQHPQEPVTATAASRPTAPDAPDLARRTVAGYELIATALSNDSEVKPLYRKFDYLNHRILLFLQDELCEMEEQLRVVDEVIAQLDTVATSSESSARIPASRRSDTYKNSEIHSRRTSLLGRIFLKTEQYNRAMAAYAALQSDSGEADEDDVHAYRKWMVKHAPVHEVETRFLQKGEDLILPGKKKKPFIEEEVPRSSEVHSPSLAAMYLPFALMFPLLLFSFIPGFVQRMIVTVCVGGATYLVAMSTDVGKMLPTRRDWVVCGAAYVVVMGVVAACIPSPGAVGTVGSQYEAAAPTAARYTVKR